MLHACYRYSERVMVLIALLFSIGLTCPSKNKTRLARYGRCSTLLLAWSLLAVPAYAQFDANTHYQQCLRFEAGEDLITARQSCENALRINPDFIDADLTLGRIEVALGEYGRALQRLQRISGQVDSAEPFVLLAEAHIRQGNFNAAAAALRTAETRLSTRPNTLQDAQRRFLSGLLEEQRGNYQAALLNYQSAINADPLDLSYRVRRAGLHLRLGNAAEAQREVEDFQSLTGTLGNGSLLSILGKARWAQSNFSGAAFAFDAAIDARLAGSVRSSSESDALAQDRSNLALVYYGQGNFRQGNVALRQAMELGGLLSSLFTAVLPWLLLLVLLFALQLVGESLVNPSNALEFVDGGPRDWTAGQIYGTLFLSFFITLLVIVAYSYLRYENLLAIITPLQQNDVRALGIAVMAFCLTLFALQRVQRNGWNALETLLGKSADIGLGLGVGIVLLAVVVAYYYYLGDMPWAMGGGFYLDFLMISPLLIAAVVLLPLAELFFRAFVMPPLTRRYHPVIAVLMSSVLSALVLVTPPLLLIAIGLALAASYKRSNDGLTPLVAQVVLHLGLLLGVSFNMWMRTLFF